MELKPSQVKYIFNGEIQYDESTSGKVPRIKIGCGDYSWEELRKYIMTYEGFKIRFEIVD